MTQTEQPPCRKVRQKVTGDSIARMILAKCKQGDTALQLHSLTEGLTGIPGLFLIHKVFHKCIKWPRAAVRDASSSLCPWHAPRRPQWTNRLPASPRSILRQRVKQQARMPPVSLQVWEAGEREKQCIQFTHFGSGVHNTVPRFVLLFLCLKLKLGTVIWPRS